MSTRKDYTLQTQTKDCLDFGESAFEQSDDGIGRRTKQKNAIEIKQEIL